MLIWVWHLPEKKEKKAEQKETGVSFCSASIFDVSSIISFYTVSGYITSLAIVYNIRLQLTSM